MTFTINNVEKIDVYLGDGLEYAKAVQFDLETPFGKDTFIEWLDFVDNVERMDSHLRFQEIEKLEALFDLSKKPPLMPLWDFLPTEEIFDALQKLIWEYNYINREKI